MNIEDIKGIGEKTLSLLNKLNITTIQELLEYYPYRYNVLNPGHLVNNVNCLVNGKVLSNPIVSYIKKNLNKLSFRVLIDNKVIDVIIFNRAFMKDKIKVGNLISLYGKYDEVKNTFLCSDIRLKVIDKMEIESVYHLVNGLSNKMIRKIMFNTLAMKYDVIDYIPKYYVDKYNFMNKKEAIYNLHNPSNINDLKRARMRTIYEELFIFSFKITYLKEKNNYYLKGISRYECKDGVEEFINKLPFKLTGDQIKTKDEIYEDLIGNKRMNRLVLGDVGSGKTIVAIIAMYINFINGYQSVMMAPTELLAMQHYEEIKKMFNSYGINVALLVGSMKKRERNEVIKDLKDKKIDIIIGTHSLINEEVKFNNLGLVITDEQHRFGVNQRNNLQNKGNRCDVLYLSATPIPRTYALTLYGDMDISIIKTKPKGRKSIITKVYKNEEIKEVLKKVLEEIKMGHQIYVVAPLIEENEDGENNMIDIIKLKDNFIKAFGKVVNIGILHGKMKQEDKDKVMNDFTNGDIKILISTTVIEVGINVKNATMMIIYNAERFGLATLHQLRGRVGRNDLQSYCYLISDYDSARLKIMEESNDGFYISEKDFELRGQGDLFGTMQSGDMKFKIADLKRDMKIFLQAKKDSEEFYKKKEFDINYQTIIRKIDFLQ